jgi:type IV pilus assembly protein PilB
MGSARAVTTTDDYSAQIALKRGLISADQLAISSPDPVALGRALADEFGMRWVGLRSRDIPAAVLAALPRSFVVERQAVPFAFEHGTLCVAVADPIAIDVIDDLAHVAGCFVEPTLATSAEIREAIERYYGREGEAQGALESAKSAAIAPATADDEVQVTETDAPVIRLVHSLIAEAARRRASDIHWEPLERRFRVRYRIDGALLEVDAPPKRLQLAVISRIKIMANLSIAEKRLPQDGRIRIETAGRPLDLRVSSLPTAHGESIVMRLLDHGGVTVSLPELGFLPDHQREFEQGIVSPDGMMLVTGPTGSGKTTTLYASLHHLNRPDRKIITVENPVEYQLAGVNQVPVNAATGMTFAAALRAMLRQAPNVVMVGEIRDRETTDIALNAALTGHNVFSTLHTNDAPSAITRLIDLGAKPFLVAAALRAVLAQRLVRKICPACKRTYRPAARERDALGLTVAALGQAEFARGIGCVDCHGTGYQGRMGIFELLPIDEATRALIYDNVTAGRLRACARQKGMRTMREDGIRKVLAGLTTIEEVVAVTVSDPL